MEESGEGSGPGGGAASESRGRPFRKTLGERHTAGWERRRREEKGEESQLLDEKGHVQMVKILLTSIIS